MHEPIDYLRKYDIIRKDTAGKENFMGKAEKYPLLMLILGVLGISLSAIFVRLSDAPSVVTATSRLLWTVALMSPVVLGRAACRKELFSLSGKQIIQSVVSGIFLAFHFALWFESLLQTSVASSTAIVCTEVVWVALGFCLFMKGRISKVSILAIGIALIGSVCIAFSDSGSGESHLYGDLLSAVSAMAISVYILLGKVARKTMSATVYTYLVYVACSVTLVILAAGQGYTVADFSLPALGAGFLLAVFSTILGHSIFSWCLKYFSPAFVSASKLCEPVVAAIVAAILFSEIPAPLQVLGGVVVIFGVYLYSREERKQTQ